MYMLYAWPGSVSRIASANIQQSSNFDSFIRSSRHVRCVRRALGVSVCEFRSTVFCVCCRRGKSAFGKNENCPYIYVTVSMEPEIVQYFQFVVCAVCGSSVRFNRISSNSYIIKLLCALRMCI